MIFEIKKFFSNSRMLFTFFRPEPPTGQALETNWCDNMEEDREEEAS